MAAFALLKIEKLRALRGWGFFTSAHDSQYSLPLPVRSIRVRSTLLSFSLAHMGVPGGPVGHPHALPFGIQLSVN